MSKKKKAEGRYNGDYHTLLEYNPISARWRVDVAFWQKDDWYVPNRIFGRFETREFRSLKSALRYRNEVRYHADLTHFSRMEGKEIEGQWVRVG